VSRLVYSKENPFTSAGAGGNCHWRCQRQTIKPCRYIQPAEQFLRLPRRV
jgi:hypothetical protein